MKSKEHKKKIESRIRDLMIDHYYDYASAYERATKELEKENDGMDNVDCNSSKSYRNDC